ncbi:restriction endonuclease subunit S [Aliivibrio fischeri]
MSKYQAYPEYKDSGVKWLENIPAHWVIYPSKRLFPESKKRADLKDQQLSATQDYGVISQERFMQLAGRRVVQLNSNQELRKRVDVDDFVISMRSFQGGLERAWEAGGIRSSYVVLKPTVQIKHGYFQYLFKSSRYIQAIQSTANFIRDGQDMNYQNFVLIDLPYPQREEQTQIAAFLDYEMAKIDTLIEKQQRLIELLKEKRQAVISHAVTKGLNPDAPMKDSGVEWLGEVPEHWDVLYIKHLSEVKRGASPRPIDDPKYFDEHGEYAWTRIADVSKAGMYLTNTTQRLSKLGSSLSVKLEPNELFLSIAGTVGKPCLTISKACIHDGFVYFPSLKINNKFLYYIFEAGQAYLGLGKMGTQLNLNTDTVGGIKIGLPSKQEIEQIIIFIEKQKDEYDTLIKKASDSINLMQERRTALISAAVTGKIDVRNWVAPTTSNTAVNEAQQEATV